MHMCKSCGTNLPPTFIKPDGTIKYLHKRTYCDNCSDERLQKQKELRSKKRVVHKTTTDNGTFGYACEHRFISECLTRSINVFSPINHFSQCDVLIEINNAYYRIQIKGSRKPSNNQVYTFTISSSKGGSIKYYDKVDFYALWCMDLDLWYIIPFDRIEPKCKRLSVSEIGALKEFKNNWAFDHCLIPARLFY
jgi:hypothetical protein